MVQASNQFHAAIRLDEPQLPLFCFGDRAFMSGIDIDQSVGFRFSEAVMNEEDFAPGACCSAELSFQVFNEAGVWSDFTYGEFDAYLGVRTNHSRVSYTGCFVAAEGNVIQGNETSPYLTFNGQAVSGVTSPVQAILLYRQECIVFLDNDTDISFRYTSTGLTRQSSALFLPPIRQAARDWKRKRQGFCFGHTQDGVTTGAVNVMVSGSGYLDAYEMISLGKMTAERPTFSTKKAISIDCYDRMQKFDTEYTMGSITYPCSLFELLQRVCNLANVPLKNSSITNGSAVLTGEPEFEGATWKDIISYIAELSGSFCRITRDGQLELRWFAPVSFNLNGHDYTECGFGYYNSAGVDKVVVRDTSEDDISAGQNGNTLYIMNNPIARKVDMYANSP